MTVVLLLVLAAALVSARGFYERVGGRVVGNRDFQARTVDLEPFRTAEVGGGITLEVERGARQIVTLRAESNVLRHVELTVTGGRLRARIRPGANLSDHGVTITAQLPVLEDVDATGGSVVRLGRGVAAEVFGARLSGGAVLRGELVSREARLGGSGGAQIELTGRVAALVLSASGGGAFRLEGLDAGEAEVDLSGGAQARVSATDVLTISLSGGSRLAYAGSPRMEIRAVSGGSSIERL